MKRSRVSLEDLKAEFLLKEFGWLTVVDVIHDGLYKCVCRCRCGREKVVDIYKLRSGHTSSCGCYSKSEEFADNQRNYLTNHPEITASSLEKYLEWRRSNPEEVALTNEKHFSHVKKRIIILKNYSPFKLLKTHFALSAPTCRVPS